MILTVIDGLLGPAPVEKGYTRKETHQEMR